MWTEWIVLLWIFRFSPFSLSADKIHPRYAFSKNWKFPKMLSENGKITTPDEDEMRNPLEGVSAREEMKKHIFECTNRQGFQLRQNFYHQPLGIRINVHPWSKVFSVEKGSVPKKYSHSHTQHSVRLLSHFVHSHCCVIRACSVVLAIGTLTHPSVFFSKITIVILHFPSCINPNR